MQKVLVMSLGGSLIVPEKVDKNYLVNFKKTIKKFYSEYKFVIVCGGGAIARQYIAALRKEKMNKKELSLAGIRATRMNAEFVMQLFGKEANDTLPLSMQKIKDNLPKNKVVICGALRYSPKSTSDGTAAKIAHFLKAEFVNMTDVRGLFTENPKENPRAKFIPKINWKEFEKKALALDYKAGQHFVLDQQGAILIKKHKIKTYILGSDLKNLKKFLSGNDFVGTVIEN